MIFTQLKQKRWEENNYYLCKLILCSKLWTKYKSAVYEWLKKMNMWKIKSKSLQDQSSTSRTLHQCTLLHQPTTIYHSSENSVDEYMNRESAATFIRREMFMMWKVESFGVPYWTLKMNNHTLVERHSQL